MNTILIVIVLFVVVFFVWATLQSNGFSMFKGGGKSKNSEKVSEQYVLPEKEKKTKVIKIKKKNIESDREKSELKKPNEDSQKGAGGGVVERVFVEPRIAEGKGDVKPEPKQNSSDDDFEKELDQLIKDLEKERKNQGKLPNRVATDTSAYKNPNLPDKSDDFDWDEFEKQLNGNNNPQNKDKAPVFDLEPEPKVEFDYFADSIKSQPKQVDKINTNNRVPQESNPEIAAATIYGTNQVVETKKDLAVSNEPLIDKSSFSERFSRGFETKKDKNSSNQVVVRNDNKNANTVAKERRKKWL